MPSLSQPATATAVATRQIGGGPMDGGYPAEPAPAPKALPSTVAPAPKSRPESATSSGRGAAAIQPAAARQRGGGPSTAPKSLPSRGKVTPPEQRMEAPALSAQRQPAPMKRAPPPSTCTQDPTVNTADFRQQLEN